MSFIFVANFRLVLLPDGHIHTFSFPAAKNTNHKTLFSQYGKQQNHKEMFIINVLGKQRSRGVVCEF